MWKRSNVKRAFVALIASCIATISLAQDEGIEASSASLIFNPESIVVNQGDRLNLNCGVKGTYRSCIWEIGAGGENQRTFQVEDVHAKIYNGISRPEDIKGNQCGIVINSVSPGDNGEWTCKVFVVAKTLIATKSIVVTIPPGQPVLNIRENPLVISENEEREVSCTVQKARPAPRIRWFIGTEDVSSRSKTQNTPINDMEDTYSSVSTLIYKFHHLDDRKYLKCSIEHPTLYEPEYSEVQLDIRYQPYPISSQKIYGIPLDNEYEIKYNFTSNPLPDLKWYVQGLEIMVPGENGRYTSSIQTLKDNIYMATLRIKDFTQEDVGLSYKLRATNDLGEKEFDITLSTGPAPPDGGYYDTNEIAAPENYDSKDTIGTGTLAAIVIIILLVLLLLFIIGVMRYRQVYCFSMRAESKAYIQDPERHDYENNCRTNEAIKASLDQLNGGPETGINVINGSGTGGTMNSNPPPPPASTMDHFNKIETIAHPQQQHYHQQHLEQQNRQQQHYQHHSQQPQHQSQQPQHHSQQPHHQHRHHSSHNHRHHHQEKKNTDV